MRPLQAVTPLRRPFDFTSWCIKQEKCTAFKALLPLLFARPEQGLPILMNLNRKYLTNLDLPCHMEIVGLKRAAAQFLDSTKTLLHWTMRRATERLWRKV
jgi:hypothetical protein